jgi:Tol biopolymer transport system component
MQYLMYGSMPRSQIHFMVKMLKTAPNWSLHHLSVDRSSLMAACEVADPDLSPSGQHRLHPMKAGAKSIWIVEYISQGARTTELTPGFGNEYDPTWSPDSQYIAFTSQRDGNDEIYVMTSTGQLQTNLSDHPGKDMFPAWQP